MNPQETREAYRRNLVEANGGPGEQVAIQRDGSAYPVNAWVTSFRPTDLVGTVIQGARYAIVLAEDVERFGFLIPIKPKQDRLLWAGKTLVIESVDDASRRIGGVIVAYVLTLAGA